MPLWRDWRIVERLLELGHRRGPMMKRSVVVRRLGTAQTLAWGSSYYLPAILADPIANVSALAHNCIRPVFGGGPTPHALVVSAVLGPSVGRCDRTIGGVEVAAFLEFPIGSWRRGSSARLARVVNPVSPGLRSGFGYGDGPL